MSIDTLKYRALLFDVDGTLVESFKTTPLPGRVERIVAPAFHGGFGLKL